MGGVILTTSTSQSVISSQRGDDAGPFGEKEKTILRSLMPPLKRAALLHGELGLLRRQLAPFTGHLERFPHAFLLVDAQRRVLYLSAAARKLVAERDGLAIDQGNVVATSRKSQASFNQAVLELAADGSTAIRRITRPSFRKSYRLILTPIEGSRSMPLGVAVPAVSILVIDAHSSARPDPEVLRELFSPSRRPRHASLSVWRWARVPRKSPPKRRPRSKRSGPTSNGFSRRPPRRARAS